MTSQQLNFVGPQSSSNSVVEWLLKWTGTDTQKADNNNKDQELKMPFQLNIYNRVEHAGKNDML